MRDFSKIKILETIRQGQVGGGETHVLDLVRGIDKNKFEVEVLSFTSGPMVDQLRAMGIQTHVIHTEKPFDFRIWKQVGQLIEKNHYDIIHAHGTRAASNVFYSSYTYGIPMIYTVHGWSFHSHQNVLTRKFREFSEYFLTKKSTVTVLVSKSNEDDGIKKFGLKNSEVIYNGINSNKFNPDKTYHDIRQELGIPKDKTLVGYMVRMTEQKDPFTLIKAIKQISLVNQDIMFLIVGNGDLLPATKQLADELGINEQIIFSDFRNDIPAILQAIDIYCLPSLWEGMPIGLLEAMAMGKACIASSVDGTKELIKDHINGLLIQPKDDQNLAKKILELHYQPELRKRLGEEAKLEIAKKFSLTTMIKRIEAMYEQILK